MNCWDALALEAINLQILLTILCRCGKLNFEYNNYRRHLSYFELFLNKTENGKIEPGMNFKINFYSGGGLIS